MNEWQNYNFPDIEHESIWAKSKDESECNFKKNLIDEFLEF